MTKKGGARHQRRVERPRLCEMDGVLSEAATPTRPNEAEGVKHIDWRSAWNGEAQGA